MDARLLIEESGDAREMKAEIVGFYQDEEKHWVAKLSCGHTQHVRHDPPWQSRPWVQTEEGRVSKMGIRLECKKCDEAQVDRGPQP